MALMGFREYARYRGVSGEAVSKAVRSGRISTIQDHNGNRKIDPAIADQEWDRNTNHTKKNVSEYIKRPSPAAEPPPEQNEQTMADSVEEPAPAPAQQQVFTPDPEAEKASKTYHQSRSIKEAYSARLQRLAYEEKLGKLINVEKVRVAAFNTARIVRDAILSVPDRISHEVASIQDPHEVHIRMTEALIEALEGLSGEYQSENSSPD
jgi:hypothetical protein